MKKLLFRILFLLLPFAVLVGAFEARFHQARNNQYIVKKSLLEAAAGEVEVLTLGSSHAYYGILPELLGRPAFNLAATSQSIYYDVELALKYLPDLPKLTTMILPISYFSLENQLDQGAERWRSYYYFRFYSIPHRSRDMAGDARNFSLYLLYGRNTDGLLKGDIDRNFDDSGGLKEENRLKTAMELQEGSVVALGRHHGAMRPGNVADNIALLEKLVQSLQKRNIRLIVVTTPVTRFYRDGVQEARCSRMQFALDGFCRRNGLQYKNYFADERFDLGDFFDADHLNRDGAVKFSRILANEVLHSQ
jgi:hypothetical protein